MSVRKLLPVALLLAAVSVRCAGSPAEPIGTVSVTQTTSTTTTTVIPAVAAGAIGALPVGTGVASATVFTFGFTTGPSGGVPPYTFQWNFGDGGTAGGDTPSHVFPVTGTFPVIVVVSDSRGITAQTLTSVPVRSVTGTWKVGFQGGTAPAAESIDLVQNGGAVVAATNDTANAFGLGAGSGSVSNPRVLSINVTFQPAAPLTPFAATLIGTLDSTVTTWTGTASGYTGCPCAFTATRVPAPGVLSAPGARR